MAFNWGMFKNVPSYDGGDANTYVKTAYLMSGEFTENVGAAVEGSPLIMFDRDVTTFYKLGSNDNGTFFVKWEFNSVIKFKNIYFTANLGGRIGQTASLKTSLNGTDWTTQDTFSSTAGILAQPLLATDVKARFIQCELVPTGGDMTSYIYLAEATI